MFQTIATINVGKTIKFLSNFILIFTCSFMILCSLDVHLNHEIVLTNYAFVLS